VAVNKDRIRASAHKHLQKGNLPKAIREYERLIAGDPNDVRSLLKIGDLQQRQGHNELACDAYSQVAQTYSKQGFFLKAAAVLKQILSINPQLLAINLKLASIYEKLELGPDARRQYLNAAMLYAERGDWHNRITILEKLVQLEPTDVPTVKALAECYIASGNTQRAYEVLE